MNRMAQAQLPPRLALPAAAAGPGKGSREEPEELTPQEDV